MPTCRLLPWKKGEPKTTPPLSLDLFMTSEMVFEKCSTGQQTSAVCTAQAPTSKKGPAALPQTCCLLNCKTQTAPYQQRAGFNNKILIGDRTGIANTTSADIYALWLGRTAEHIIDRWQQNKENVHPLRHQNRLQTSCDKDVEVNCSAMQNKRHSTYVVVQKHGTA